jgi:hypothetical protein
VELQVPLRQVGQIGILRHRPDRGAVRVDQEQATTRSEQGRQVGDDRVLPAAVVRQHVPQHHHVLRAGQQARPLRLACLDGDVDQAGLGNQGTGRRHRVGIGIDRGNLPARSHGVSQRGQQRTWPAADVGDLGSRRDARLLPQSGLGGSGLLGYQPVARHLGLVQCERVPPVRRHRRVPRRRAVRGIGRRHPELLVP